MGDIRQFINDWATTFAAVLGLLMAWEKFKFWDKTKAWMKKANLFRRMDLVEVSVEVVTARISGLDAAGGYTERSKDASRNFSRGGGVDDEEE